MTEEGDEDGGFTLDPTIKHWAGLALAFVAFVWLIYYRIATDNLPLEQRGDLFGSLNALFSGLAFTGVIITIMMQSRELALQRRELKQSVKAQRDQAAATARLHEQAEERTKQEHALRVLSAHQDWLSANRKAWQAVTHYLTYKEETKKGFITRTVVDAKRHLNPTEDHALHAWRDATESEIRHWLRQAEEDIIAVDTSADAVEVLDPHRLPDVNWQRLIENGLKGQCGDEFKKRTGAFEQAAKRLGRLFPTLPD